MSGPRGDWTDERKDEVRRLWAEGRSARQIANVLGGGATRLSVLGIVHRNKAAWGIPDRPPRRHSGPLKARGPRTPKPPTSRRAGWVAHKATARNGFTLRLAKDVDGLGNIVTYSVQLFGSLAAQGRRLPELTADAAIDAFVRLYRRHIIREAA